MAFAVGYVLGTRAGREGMEQLLDAVEEIVRSEEVQALAVSALNLAGGPLREALLPSDERGARSSPVVQIAMGVLSGFSRRAA
ncbi:MAG: hypothetical protein M3069_03800 [Chloroflexota bacterium]|nr:hypothetical protein [Chloroflexota bacterium]